jgi:hypothetical protein
MSLLVSTQVCVDGTAAEEVCRCLFSVIAGSGQESGVEKGWQLLAPVEAGDRQEVERLLAAGADPNALIPSKNALGMAESKTSLGQAAKRGNVEVVQMLLEAGADPDLANSNGFRPLMAAASVGRLAVLRLLLQVGAQIESPDPCDGSTAFHYACFGGQPESAEVLVRAGCNIAAADLAGATRISARVVQSFSCGPVYFISNYPYKTNRAA